jgi:hypothetical protein
MPMSLKSKFPSNPPSHPASVMRSFASGGCTSIKNLPLMYLVANPPKLRARLDINCIKLLTVYLTGLRRRRHCWAERF